MPVLEESADRVRHWLEPSLDTLTIERVVVGLFFTGVKLSNGVGGICYTPIRSIPEAVCCPTSSGRFFDPTTVPGTAARDLLESLASDELLRTAAAVATLNALSASCWALGLTGSYTIAEGANAKDSVRMPVESSVAVIGALVPTLKQLRKRGGTWWVIEQDERTLKADELEHYVPFDACESTIACADVLVVTGVTLLNHTIERILAASKPGAEIAVIGPTASMLPEPLFERGVRVVGGVRVDRSDALLDILAAGGSGYHFFDRHATRIVLTRSNEP